MAVSDMLSRLHEKSEKVKISNLSEINISDFWVKQGACLSDFENAQNNDSDLLNAKTSEYWKNTIPKKQKLLIQTVYLILLIKMITK